MFENGDLTDGNFAQLLFCKKAAVAYGKAFSKLNDVPAQLQKLYLGKKDFFH